MPLALTPSDTPVGLVLACLLVGSLVFLLVRRWQYLVFERGERPGLTLMPGTGLADIAAAFGCFSASVACFGVWIDPVGNGGGARLTWLTTLMMVEFVAMHAGGLLGNLAFGPGSPVARTLKVSALGLFYVAVGVSFSLLKDDWTYLGILGGLVLMHISHAFTPRPADEKLEAMRITWGGSFLLLILTLIFAQVVGVPAFGFNEATIGQLAADNWGMPGGSTMTWGDSGPAQWLAWGAFYYAALGVARLLIPMELAFDDDDDESDTGNMPDDTPPATA